MVDFFSINKLSSLHGNNIVFCKTDFLLDEFNSIRKNRKNVILITGNSDIEITFKDYYRKPSFVKYWFAQNLKTNFGKIYPLPIGLENKYESDRSGHGIGYFDRVSEKEFFINKFMNYKGPNKFAYCNFDIETNKRTRDKIFNVCLKLPYIDNEFSKLSIEDYYEKITNYEIIICPEGNGIDTHRLWEVLYLNRIPLIIRTGNHKIYELYNQLPIIILNSINELNNFKLLEYKLSKIKAKKFDLSLLDANSWRSKIIGYSNLI